MIRVLALFCGILIAVNGAAQAGENFPFARSVKMLDFSTPNAQNEFEDIVQKAATTPLIYIDWHFAHFTDNEVFKRFNPGDVSDNPDDAACEKLASEGGTLSVGGRPNGDNNHLLVEFDLWTSDADPFTTASCEYVGSTAANGLRIRGFYYVADVRIATANKYVFRPLAVSAVDIPKGFLGEGN